MFIAPPAGINLKPHLRRENKINEDVSKLQRSAEEEKKKLNEKLQLESKVNDAMKNEIEELKNENIFLKRENERWIDIEKRTRNSNDRLWSLIEEQQKTEFKRSLSLGEQNLKTEWVCLKRITSSSNKN